MDLLNVKLPINPCEESEKDHRDVEPGHDEEVEDAVLKDRSHQPVHAGLAVVSLEPEDEEDDADDGDEVCEVCEDFG